MNIAEQLINKPLTIYAKGKKRTIGKITSAKVVDDSSVRIDATIDDPVMRRVLGVSSAKDVKIAAQVANVTSS